MEAIVALVFVAIFIGILVVVLMGTYKCFKKMGYEDAWWSIVPILNILFFLKIAEKPTWWIVLCLLPYINIVVQIYIYYLVGKKVAPAYGKGDGFAIGVAIVPFILFPILGFSKEEPVRVA